MTTAEDIAARYDLAPSDDSYVGECPACLYRGFTVTERDRRILVYCHGGGCSQGEIISALRDAELWGEPATALFAALDPAPIAAARPKHQRDGKNVEHALELWRRSQPAEGTPVETYLRARGYRLPICLIPGFDGALFSIEWKDALWARFSTAAPRRQRRSVERYNIVKRA
jgi:hypothetical protein